MCVLYVKDKVICVFQLYNTNCCYSKLILLMNPKSLIGVGHFNYIVKFIHEDYETVLA